MNTLFEVEPIFPAGFEYLDDFISAEEEQRLLQTLTGIEFHPFVFQGYTANRKVVSYGYDYSFTNRNLSKGNEIPSEIDFLIEKVAQHLMLKKDDFAELLVTEYPAGSVINWHRDAPPFDIIAGISLLSDCIFKLRPQEKLRQTRGNIISTTVKRRSLYVMQGESRSEWQHSIAPVQNTRYSITLRTLRK